MRLIVEVTSGIWELNWTWLPSFIGLNTNLKAKLEKELSEVAVGKTADQLNDIILDYLCTTFPVKGLRDYLDGLKFVEE